jgi:hypothetical protein
MINKQRLLFSLPILFVMQSLLALELTDLTSWEIAIEQEGDFFPDYEKEPYDTWRAVKAFTRSCATDVDGIIQAQGILQKDLYNYTHPINQRSIHDLPQFYFLLCPPPCACKSWQFLVEPFYNDTHKGNFTKDSTAIKAYINFGLAKDFEPFAIDIDLPHVLSLFEDLKIQERRGGIMVGGTKSFGSWYFHIRTPVEYLIRNFFLTDAELKAIDAEPLFNDDDSSTDNDEETNNFTRRHLIADRIGIGDTRLNIGHTIIDNPGVLLDLGFEATIPTAFALKKGLYGHHFPKDQLTPTFDLIAFLNLATTDPLQAQEEGKDFLLAAIDRFSRILLETGLGNNGHLGLGIFSYNDICITRHFNFKTRATLEYLLPGFERRYFIKKKNPSDFELLNVNNIDPNNCEKELIFLQNQIIDTLFPSGFDTLVYPGFIVKLTNVISGTLAQRWQLALGYDIWWQQRENFGRIKAPDADRSELRKKIALRPTAFQSKIFGSATMFKKGPACNCDWSLSLYVDKTFLRSGIGKDFNIALRFELLL